MDGGCTLPWETAPGRPPRESKHGAARAYQIGVRKAVLLRQPLGAQVCVTAVNVVGLADHRPRDRCRGQHRRVSVGEIRKVHASACCRWSQGSASTWWDVVAGAPEAVGVAIQGGVNLLVLSVAAHGQLVGRCSGTLCVHGGRTGEGDAEADGGYLWVALLRRPVGVGIGCISREELIGGDADHDMPVSLQPPEEALLRLSLQHSGVKQRTHGLGAAADCATRRQVVPSVGMHGCGMFGKRLTL